MQALEFAPAERLRALQGEQLQALLEHHARHTPWFAARLAAQDLTPQALAIGSPAWLRLAPLRRAELQAAGKRLFSHLVPPLHLPVTYGESSGSTGEPVVVRRTRFNQLLVQANSARDHLWHGRPAHGGRVAVVRNRFGEVKETGRGIGIPVGTPMPELARLIARFEPDTLMIYPGNLMALLDEWRLASATPPPASLRHLRTMGETVRDALRERARNELGLAIEDGYSSEELGALAAQCPVSGLYHTLDESVLLEVVREADGQPCAPGEIGQILVTDLHNFATPLIRYSVGDLAEPGPACTCGRALGTWRRIVGRERNLLRLPDGTRRWPLLHDQDYASVAPVRQYQALQHSLSEVELRVVVEGGLSPAQAEGLAQIVRKALAAPVEVRVEEFQGRLPVGPNGKFEDFVCLIRD